MRSHQHEMRVAVAIAAEYIAGVAAISQAIRYVYAAHRDERDGFLYTAASEWRHAADLFTLNNQGVEYCWRQWERIMRLPRSFAVPISDPPERIEVAV